MKIITPFCFTQKAVKVFNWHQLVLIILIVFGLFKTKVNAQISNPIIEVNNQLRTIFSSLDKPSVHPHFLFEMAAHVIDSGLYIDNYPDAINYDTWNMMYSEMRSSAYDTTNMITADSVYKYDLQVNRDTLTMNIMAYNYYRFKDTALKSNIYFDFDTVNNILIDKYPRPGYPYKEHTVFAAAPSARVAAYNTFTFRIDPKMIFNDEFNPIHEDGFILSIDFGDGTGYHDFPDANTQTCFYDVDYSTLGVGPGDIIIKTALRFGVGGPIAKLSKSILNILFDKKKDTPPDAYLMFEGLTVGVYSPCDEGDNSPSKKYLIYCEGWDPGDLFPFLNRGPATIYESSIQDSRLSDLRNFGYEIYVVDWVNSGRPIEENAQNLIYLIEYIKCVIAASDNPDEQIVIMGESMGGLVARYALARMEQTPPILADPCMPEKMHNCRLLITMDAPNNGANVPLAYQHLYRNPLFSANPMMGITQRTLGWLMDVLLDGHAAKEMLLYHVDTRFPPLIYGPGFYWAHPERGNFLMNLSMLGNYPKYCKMVAMSNGSIAGKGQTKPWDGQLRSAGDNLAFYTQDASVNVLWRNYKIYDLEASMNTLPAGNGPICNLKAQIWNPRLKVYWFGIKIKMEPLPFINHHYDGLNITPYDVAPGSTLAYVNDFYDGGFLSLKNLLFGFGLFGSSYLGNGHYHYGTSAGGKFFGGGFNLDLYSDGMHFCFIPTVSALDYDYTNLWDDIENSPVATVLSKTPFDVITGIPENDPYLIFNGYGNDFENITLFSKPHLMIRNEPLGYWKNGIANQFSQVYDDCYPRYVYFLNREIGDDSLFVENREMPYKGMYSAEKYVGVNQHSVYYEYPGYSTPWAIPGVYSKDNPLNISGSNGYGVFYAQNADVQYDPPYTGAYSINPLYWSACCNNGYKPEPSSISTPENNYINDVIIYPNPITSDYVNLYFDSQENHSGTIEVIDILGRVLITQKFNVNGKYYKFKLDEKLSSGLYLFLIKDGTNQYKSKVFIKR